MGNSLQGKNFVCIFPWLTDSTAIKCTGQICETIAIKYNTNSSIVTYKNEEYPRYKKYCPNTKLVFLKGSLNNKGKIVFKDLLRFILLNLKKIDILYLYHFPTDRVVIPTIGVLYKLLKKNGVLFVRLESDVNDLPEEFPILKQKKLSERIKNCISLLFYKKLDVLGVIDNPSFDLSSKKLKLYQYANKKIRVQLNGYKLYEQVPLKKFEDKRDRIVLAGRLNSPQKGLDIFLEALKYVDLKNWDIMLLGEITKEQIDKIRWIENENVCNKGKIIISGYISDVSVYLDVLNASKIFCLPSRYDGIPLVIPDAMARGCIIVGSDLFGIKEIATDNGRCGFFFPNGDSIKLASILNDIIDGKFNLTELSYQSRERAERIFHWDSIIENLHLEEFIR